MYTDFMEEYIQNVGILNNSSLKNGEDSICPNTSDQFYCSGCIPLNMCIIDL